jgi:L-asparaginase II
VLAARTRSGLDETIHHGAVAVMSADGSLVASSGDIDQPFFIRSASKPFQALVAQESGAALQPTQLAVAAGSHDGEPAHAALVEKMLAERGLEEDDLLCPPTPPLSAAATRRYREQGADRDRRTWNNCSGKHAAWLRACHAQGWPTRGYLDPDHPIPVLVTGVVAELGGLEPTPVGVDGCGAPVHRTTARAMALLYARLAAEPRMREVFTAMHRYPALASGVGNGDALIATALNAAAKRGAAGCLGVAIDRRYGLAVKAWDGLQDVAYSAAIATLAALGEIPKAAWASLESLARPKVYGGEQVVGELEPRVTLQWA